MKVNKTLSYFWAHAWRYPKYVIGLAIAMPITISLQFFPSIIAAGTLDRLSTGNFDPHNIWHSFGADIIWYAVVGILGAVIAWRIVIVLIWRLEAKVMRNINIEAFDHLMQMSASFHANRFGGALVSQVGKLSSSYMRFADTTVFTVGQLVLSFIFTAFFLTPLVPGYVLALFAFSAIFIGATILYTKKIRALNAREADLQNKQTGYLADAITNVFAVKSFSAARAEQKRFAAASQNTVDATMDIMRAVIKRDMFFGSITSTITICSFIAAIVSVTLFNAEVATVFLVLNFTGMVIRNLWEFCHTGMRSYNRAFGDSEAMMEILGMQPEVTDPPRPEPVRIKQGAIAFNKVDFRHIDEKGDSLLFSELDLAIAPGERVGLVGHSGSGKTTLTKLLMRFSDVTNGSIAIDGQNIAAITQDDLRKNIAYVPQEPLLFHRSLFENIAYGRPGATKKQVHAAAKAAHAAEFIEKLADTYETLVGERGVKLSGGQRQRIAIARAMLKDAPILVLDEATSALDSESERLIQSALWELMKGRTAIVIAHRLSTIQRMDRIVVLEDGAIIEQGSHKELLAKKGVYATLWEHQSGGFIEE
ncbi:MAG TPA: ABC transporter ATP-binding protein [Candidatus Saccharimonadales bacterium]|nr:ABC transporter ATP-binding protein [Candidatus Saccharimonadales bacterium]